MEQKRPKVGVGVIVIKNQELLLGKRKGSTGKGEWSLPGGHLEYKETVDDCAKRELFEETGLKALKLRLGPWSNDIIDEEKHYITIFVFVKQFEGEPQLMEPDKCEGWQWFDLKELPSPLFTPLDSLIKSTDLKSMDSCA